MNRKSVLRWALALATALLAACSDSDDEEIVVEQPPQAARKVSAIFVDAATSRPVTAALDVTVRTPTGALSTASLNGARQAQNRFTVTNGILVFEVDPNAALPVALQVVATADGYDPASASVNVTANGTFETVGRMVNRAAPPAGAVSVSRPLGIASASGATASEIVVTTAATQTAPAVQLTVPAATTLLDAAGQPLTGALTAKLSYYNAAESAALAMLPGAGKAVVANGAAQEAGRFVTAGFATVEIQDASGRKAATSSNPMPITINLAPVTNPNTGAPVASGSSMPFWSYTAEAGRWASEGLASVTLDAASRLQATGQPSHLTLFTAGWLDTRTCSTPAKLVLSGNEARANLKAVLVRQGGGSVDTYAVAGTQTELTLTDALPDASTVSFRLDGTEVGQATVTNPCGGAQVPVFVNVPFSFPATMTVNVFRSCQEDPSNRVSVGNAGTVVVVPQSAEAMPIVQSTTDGSAMFAGLRGNIAYSISVGAFGVPQGAVVTRTLVPNQSVTVEILLPMLCSGTGATGATR